MFNKLKDYININELEVDKQYRVNCCYCSDTRRRLYVKLTSDNKLLAHCFNCGFKLNKTVLIMNKNKKANITITSKKNKQYKLNVVDNIPKNYKQWLLSYGIDKKLIKRYGIKYDSISDRIAVPCNTGYVLRSIYDVKAKWLNYGASYFYNNCPLNGRLILVEDSISAIVLSKLKLAGIALLGLNINQKLKQWLLNIDLNTRLIIWFDNDKAGLLGAIKARRELEIYFKNILIIKAEEPKKAGGVDKIKQILNI